MSSQIPLDLKSSPIVFNGAVVAKYTMPSEDMVKLMEYINSASWFTVFAQDQVFVMAPTDPNDNSILFWWLWDYMPLESIIDEVTKKAQILRIPTSAKQEVLALNQIGGYQKPAEMVHFLFHKMFYWGGIYTTLPGKRDEVLAALTQFSQIIERTEEETRGYLIFKVIDGLGGDRIWLWETFNSENAYKEIHAKSKHANHLKDKIGHLLKDRSMSGYHTVGKGSEIEGSIQPY